MTKQPFLKFYTSDWRADPRLRMCSLAARGLWTEFICLMHEASPYGHLLVSGVSPTNDQLAALVGAPSDEVAAALGELEAAGVFSKTRGGIIYSRKLTRMEKKAATARNNGRKGGNPTLGKEKNNPSSDKGEDMGHNKPQKPYSREPYSKTDDDDDAGASARSDDPPETPPEPPNAVFRERLLRAVGADPVSGLHGPNGRMLGKAADMAEAGRWTGDLGLTEAQCVAVVLEVMARKRDGPPATFRYFTPAMQELAGALKAPNITPITGGTNGTADRAPGQRKPSGDDIARAADAILAAWG